MNIGRAFFIYLLSYLASGCSTNADDYSKKNYVEFENIQVLRVNQLNKVIKFRSATIFQNKKQLEHFINDSTDVYFDFKNEILSFSLDFDKYDYIFSRGREIDSLSYSRPFTEKYDACTAKDKTALQKIYKNTSNDSLLFIYRLKEKNKYRDPCG